MRQRLLAIAVLGTIAVFVPAAPAAADYTRAVVPSAPAAESTLGTSQFQSFGALADYTRKTPQTVIDASQWQPLFQSFDDEFYHRAYCVENLPEPCLEVITAEVKNLGCGAGGMGGNAQVTLKNWANNASDPDAPYQLWVRKKVSWNNWPKVFGEDGYAPHGDYTLPQFAGMQPGEYLVTVTWGKRLYFGGAYLDFRHCLPVPVPPPPPGA